MLENVREYDVETKLWKANEAELSAIAEEQAHFESLDALAAGPLHCC